MTHIICSFIVGSEMYICTVNIFNNQHGIVLSTPKFSTLNGLTNVALEWYSFSSNYSRSIISFCYCDSTLKFSTADSIYILQGILSDT